MRKLARITSIITISTVVVWGGVHVGPSSNQVDAKVFDTLLSFAKGMPDYLFDQGESAEPRRIKVNGIQTYLTVQQSDDAIADILDFYADQYESIQLDPKLMEAAEKIEGDPSADKFVQAHQVLDCMRKDRQFRYEVENYGFWGTFEFRDKNLKLGGVDYLEKLGKAIESGQLGQIGTFRVTMALKRGENGSTRILNFWTDEDFNLNHLHPDDTGDMPGEDIENIPRFVGAVRQLSVAQENQRTLDRVVVYASEGSVINHILYYHSMMANEGWQADPSIEKVIQKQTNANVMFYKRKGRECTISIDPDVDSGKIITTIMDRKTTSA